MSYVMTNRIQNPELREFIQDSIEECFDIMDSGDLKLVLKTVNKSV